MVSGIALCTCTSLLLLEITDQFVRQFDKFTAAPMCCSRHHSQLRSSASKRSDDVSNSCVQLASLYWAVMSCKKHRAVGIVMLPMELITQNQIRDRMSCSKAAKSLVSRRTAKRQMPAGPHQSKLYSILPPTQQSHHYPPFFLSWQTYFDVFYSVAKSSRLQAKLSRLSELRASRKKRSSDTVGNLDTPCARTNRFLSQLTSSVTGAAGPGTTAEQELQSTRDSLNTAHANIATLREQLASKTLQLEQANGSPEEDGNPPALAHENEQLREALLLAKTELERLQGVIQTMHDEQEVQVVTPTEIYSDQNSSVLYSVQNSVADVSNVSMGIDMTTTPSRIQDQDASMSLFLDPEMQRYLLRLAEEGADLMHIMEEQVRTATS